MLGTRGVRLGVIKPGLYAMQVRALIEAALDRAKAGGKPVVEIMIPLTVTREEMAEARGWVTEAIAEAMKGSRRKLDVTIGTMIETPRGRAAGRRDRRGGRLLQLRHQRPHPDDVRVQPRRRRGPADARLPEHGPAAPQPVRDHRRRRRRRPGATARRAGPDGQRPTSSWACAASTAATPSRSPSSSGSGSTTCRARRSGCPWPAWPRRRRSSPPPDPPAPTGFGELAGGPIHCVRTEGE